MPNNYTFRITRQGYNAKTESVLSPNMVFALDSDTTLTTPKIFATIKFTATGSYAHGLGYPPQFFVIQHKTTGEYVHDVGSTLALTKGINADSTYIYCTLPTGVDEVYVILCIDPLNE